MRALAVALVVRAPLTRFEYLGSVPYFSGGHVAPHSHAACRAHSRHRRRLVSNAFWNTKTWLQGGDLNQGYTSDICIGGRTPRRRCRSNAGVVEDAPEFPASSSAFSASCTASGQPSTHGRRGFGRAEDLSRTSCCG